MHRNYLEAFNILKKDGKDEKSCDLQLMHFIKNGLVSHLKDTKAAAAVV